MEFSIKNNEYDESDGSCVFDGENDEFHEYDNHKNDHIDHNNKHDQGYDHTTTIQYY